MTIIQYTCMYHETKIMANFDNTPMKILMDTSEKVLFLENLGWRRIKLVWATFAGLKRVFISKLPKYFKTKGFEEWKWLEFA